MRVGRGLRTVECCAQEVLRDVDLQRNITWYAGLENAVGSAEVGVCMGLAVGRESGEEGGVAVEDFVRGVLEDPEGVEGGENGEVMLHSFITSES